MDALNIFLLVAGLLLDGLLITMLLGSWASPHGSHLGPLDVTIFAVGTTLGSVAAATGYLGMLIRKR